MIRELLAAFGNDLLGLDPDRLSQAVADRANAERIGADVASADASGVTF